VPGIAFGADDYIRISYATSMANLEKGLERIEKFCKGLKLPEASPQQETASSTVKEDEFQMTDSPQFTKFCDALMTTAGCTKKDVIAYFKQMESDNAALYQEIIADIRVRKNEEAHIYKALKWIFSRPT
jgi:hypothetical protein